MPESPPKRQRKPKTADGAAGPKSKPAAKKSKRPKPDEAEEADQAAPAEKRRKRPEADQPAAAVAPAANQEGLRAPQDAPAGTTATGSSEPSLLGEEWVPLTSAVGLACGSAAQRTQCSSHGYLRDHLPWCILIPCYLLAALQCAVLYADCDLSSTEQYRATHDCVFRTRKLLA